MYGTIIMIYPRGFAGSSGVQCNVGRRKSHEDLLLGVECLHIPFTGALATATVTLLCFGFALQKKNDNKNGEKKCYLPFNDWIERLSRDVSLNRCSLFIFFYMECSNHLIGLIKFKVQYVSYPKLMRIINFDNSFWLLIFKIVNNSRTGHRWDCSTPNTSLYI